MTYEATVAEEAQKMAGAMGTFERVVYSTGRVLVKKAFEQTLLTDPEDVGTTVQYMAPELNKRGRIVCRLMNLLVKDDDRLVARFLNLNDEAINNPEAVSIFDRNGRIEVA